jgi:uncharacterized damage-inducible protein DinB
MNQAQRILEEYDEAMHGEAWYGDAVWKVLDGGDAATAAAQPIAGAHSIWQLVKHMAFWEHVAVQRATGPVTPDEKLNFPEEAKLDEAKWRETLAEFRQTNREFRELLQRMDPAKLDETPAGRQQPWRVELLGVLHRHIYHAGPDRAAEEGVALKTSPHFRIACSWQNAGARSHSSPTEGTEDTQR